MDQILLFPPGGSPPAPSFIPLGSWLMGDPGPDFGAKGLIQSLESSNALTDGGRFSFRYAPPRKMSLPLILNPLYGVNRMPNPDFETGTYYPHTLSVTNATAQVQASAAQAPPYSGQYALIATVAVASGYARWTSPDFPQSAIPTGEPLLFAVTFGNLGPSVSPHIGAFLEPKLRTASGVTIIYPDTAAPGYVFGMNSLGSGGVGSFANAAVPSGWTKIGGIFSAQMLASLLPGASNLYFDIYFANNPAGASYVTAGLDGIEFRAAYPPRAVREWEGQIREYSTPGAYISVQPEGVPSQEAVFFDVLDGRWEPDYNIYENRAGVRKGTLYLDTQPFGYWPTEILLASSASVGWMGQLPVNGASVIGDVPPLAHVTIMPTVASVYSLDGGFPWLTDMVGLSFGGKASFVPFIPPASFSAVTMTAVGLSVVPTLTADPLAPASQALRWTIASQGGAFASGAWLNFALGGPATALEPAWRGRFRVFSLLKLNPSNTYGFTIIDAVRGPSAMYPALATSNQLATFCGMGSTSPAFVSPNPGYTMLDMGELTLPPSGSGVMQAPLIRLWANFPSPPVGSTQFFFGGLYLLPVDGAAGILVRGLAIPSIGGAFAGGAGAFVAPTQGGVELNGGFVDSIYLIPNAPPSAPLPAQIIGDGRAAYRGLTPRLGASTSQLLFITGDRERGATGIVGQANLEHSTVSVSYRPTFQFLEGV